MIKHIVMFKLKDASSENINHLREALLELKAKIPVLQKLEVGVNFAEGERAMHLVLTTAFQNREDLQTYAKHPDHQPVLALVRELCSESRVVDYEA